MFIQSQVHRSLGSGLRNWLWVLVAALVGAQAQGQEGCTTCGPVGTAGCKECCPRPYKHWFEGPAKIYFKRGCPRPIADPCRLPHYGYYPTCWRKWPWPEDWSHCAAPTPGALVPPSMGRQLPVPEGTEDLSPGIPVPSGKDPEKSINPDNGTLPEPPLTRLPDRINKTAREVPVVNPSVQKPIVESPARPVVDSGEKPDPMVGESDSVSLLQKPVREKKSVPEAKPPVQPMPQPEETAGQVKQPMNVSQVGVQPRVRHINNRRIILECSREELGPIIPGQTQVDLWFTTNARSWKKTQTITHKGPPYEVRVSRDGLYGFTLLAHPVKMTQMGPKPGDAPQIWVQVDTQNPAVQLVSAKPMVGEKGPILAVSWKASDEHLDERVVSVLWSKSPEGPWTPIAENAPNAGSLKWTVPAKIPSLIHLKVQASDQSGNVGSAQTTRPVMIPQLH